MSTICAYTDRIAELETLTAELADAKLRLSHANTEGKHIVRHQIRQIKRDIWRNRANLGEKI